MKSSVVNIESVSNNAFGTGFVIDSDEKGVYILTCQHVLDDVEIPVVENVLAKVIAKGNFIDMAVLYVSKLQLAALALQTESVDDLNVEVIGFSTFNKTLTQKKHIKATLYEESIELHSKEDDAYYNVRKIKANDGFNFDRGNSGSPVICKSSGAVIAMVSNKEGAELAYAINIENLKTVWKDVPSKLFESHKKTPPIKTVIEPVSGVKETFSPLPKDSSTTDKPSSSMGKYFIGSILTIGLGIGTYTLFSPSNPLQKKDNASQIETLPTKEDSKQKAEKIAKEKELKYQKELQRKEILKKTLTYEKLGFQEILNRKYNNALRYFKRANQAMPSFHHIPQITTLLKNNVLKMNNITIRKRVLTDILDKYSKYAPVGFSNNLRKQLKQSRPPKSKKLPKLREQIQYNHIKTINPNKVRVKEPLKADLSHYNLGKSIKPIEPKK